MKNKLTKAQREVIEALRFSVKERGWASAEVGPGGVHARAADALVRKGYCEYGTTIPWGDGPCYRIIRLTRLTEESK